MYLCLASAWRLKRLTNLWVYENRRELAECHFRDAILVLGPVKAEWLSRTLQGMEGDPGKLARGEYVLRPCGGCGCYLDKPRIPTPYGFVDHK